MSTDNQNQKPLIKPQVVTQYENLSEKNNSFKQLHMHEQRAVEREVELQVLGHQKSETYGSWVNHPKEAPNNELTNAKLLAKALTHNYSSNPQKVKELVIRDNRANYMQCFSHNNDADKNRRVQSIATRLDNNYQAISKSNTQVKTSER